MAVLIESNNITRATSRLIKQVRAHLGQEKAQLDSVIRIFLTCAMLCCFTNIAIATPTLDEDHFLDLSLEELMDIRVVNVSSVTRNNQKLSEVASAIFVITQDDIRRSGVTNIPDALRMAPGVQVGRIGTDKWAVSIRGFNGLSSSKVQVLVDGRSDYSPVIIGTLWSQEDTFIEDIDRIEIIRGPAASVWGTNAMNGVINIITKKASDTQGAFLTIGGGSFERGFLGARYGGKINDKTPYRIYAKGFSRDSTHNLSGTDNHDQWHSARTGFRIDHSRNNDQFTLQGELFYNALGQTLDKNILNLPSITGKGQRNNQKGGYMRFRWDRTFSDKSSLWLQAAYDRFYYQLLPFSKYETESIDIDFQHNFPIVDKYNFTWGAHYRSNRSKIADTEASTFNPKEATNHFFSGFARGDFTLIPDRLLFAIGTRVDHNEFSGLEVQPTARLTWTPNKHQSLWMAVSRAIRVPSRSEANATAHFSFDTSSPGFPSSPFPIRNSVTSNGNINSEKLLAYELGYRHFFSPRASIDIAGFVNDYSNLRDFRFGALSLGPEPPLHLNVPLILNNNASALTYGFEVSADWIPFDQWRLQGNYSYLDMHISSNPLFKEFDGLTGGAAKTNPQHQLSLRSNYDISSKLQLNLWVRYVSDVAFYNIPDYITMDAKLIFKPVKNIELFLVGQNLFREKQREYVSDIIATPATHIPRGIYVGAQWRF